MKIEEIQKHIDAIIGKTFKALHAIFQGESKDVRLIFPNYRSGKTRYSEQELRFIFIEVFNQYCCNKLNWYYSVETPTIEKYRFSGKGKRSAAIDLVIHDEQKERIALIEFKAKLHVPAHFDKDFYKLNNEPGESARYFIMYVPSSDSGTAPTIQNDKISQKGNKTIFVCFDLKHNNYLFDERLNKE